MSILTCKNEPKVAAEDVSSSRSSIHLKFTSYTWTFNCPWLLRVTQSQLLFFNYYLFRFNLSCIQISLSWPLFCVTMVQIIQTRNSALWINFYLCIQHFWQPKPCHWHWRYWHQPHIRTHWYRICISYKKVFCTQSCCSAVNYVSILGAVLQSFYVLFFTLTKTSLSLQSFLLFWVSVKIFVPNHFLFWKSFFFLRWHHYVKTL